jgi:hypothetical protein
MTSSEISALGRKKAIRATLTGIIIYLSILFLKETQGDLANGALFFFSDLVNILFLILMTILFSATYFLGGKAGIAIISGNKNFFLIAITNAFIICIALIALPLIVGLSKDAFRSSNAVKSMLTSALAIFISLLLIWLWIGYRLRSAKNN